MHADAGTQGWSLQVHICEALTPPQKLPRKGFQQLRSHNSV